MQQGVRIFHPPGLGEGDGSKEKRIFFRVGHNNRAVCSHPDYILPTDFHTDGMGE
jgi:hypothetical protein